MISAIGQLAFYVMVISTGIATAKYSSKHDEFFLGIAAGGALYTIWYAIHLEVDRIIDEIRRNRG